MLERQGNQRQRPIDERLQCRTLRAAAKKEGNRWARD
jgi:hypothetical protein